VDHTILQTAIRNILCRMGPFPREPVVVVCSEDKRPLGHGLAQGCAASGVRHHLYTPRSPGDRALLHRARESALAAASAGSLVVLMDQAYAPWVFELLGRPDEAVAFPEEHLYCDWMLPLPALLRMLQADYAALTAWTRWLLRRLGHAREMHVTTPAGTDLYLSVGQWTGLDGEVCAAVTGAHGRLVVDGALYWGAPSAPVALQVADGRVIRADELDTADPAQRMLKADLTRDGSSAMVAELGLGTNACSDPLGEIMEAEMARGTAHVGFGRNTFLGGTVESAGHIDVGLLRPTLSCNGQVLCEGGRYPL